MLDFAAFSASEPGLLKRDLEKKGSLTVLKALFPSRPINICYTEYNKPYLQGFQEHISISHSHDKLAVLVNERESTGVDVEMIRDKVLTVRHKFLNTEELAFAGSDVETLITLWAAKEAMYKAYGLKNVDFAQDMNVETNTLSDIFYGTLQQQKIKKRYRMKKEKYDNYILVYILNEV